MSLRPGKQRPGAAGQGQGAAAADAAADAARRPQPDPLTEQAGPLPAKEDRIYVDNSSLPDLKATCDDAVERILTRPSGRLAPAPSPSYAVTSPSASATDLTASPSLSNGHPDPPEFPPFKASHLHMDLRLALGFTASFIIIGVCLWSYFIEKEWQNSKWWTGAAIAAYAILSGLQALDAYLQGDRIFVGKRKMLSKRIETELLTISSPSLSKATVEETSEGQKWIVPPMYSLQVEYTRRSNGGKSLLRRVKQTVDLGHLGEWFTEEGEFVEAIFENKLIGALERSWGLGEE